MAVQREPVPWRTIWAAIASVVSVWLGYQVLVSLSRVLTWIVVAVFFAIVLTPPVDFLEHRLRIRRGLSTFLVFFLGLGLIALAVYSFVRPVVEQATNFSSDLPHYVQDARDGKGWIGDLVRRYDLEQKVTDNQAKIQQYLTDLGAPALDFARSVFSTVLALLTIVVLTFLMLMQGPSIADATLKLLPDERRRERVRRVAVDSARAVSGYVFGNVLISVVAGLAAWVALAVQGIPYAGTFGLFVAFADIIPLVGATLGAVPTIGFAFLHGVPSGVITTIFFIVYQQFENQVLQVTIMAKTVKINPLTVLISVLVGVELFGFLGALLAIPVAGVLQVVIRDIYDESRGRLKDEPSVGADEVPVSEAPETS